MSAPNSTKLTSVWVVDDDVSIAWVLEKALSKNGYQVTVFRSVKPMLQALKSDRPDVVISDVQMPGVDGLKLLELLTENLPMIPVIIMTAYSDFKTTIASYQKGAFEYLSKPFDIHKVLELVARAAKQKQKDTFSHEEAAPEPFDSSSRAGFWQKEFEQRANSLLASQKTDVARTLYREIDRILILSALEHTGGHKQKAAVALGWGRNTLTRKMQDLGM